MSATCKFCGKPILWVRMQNSGKKHPVDLPLKKLVVVNGDQTIGAVRNASSSHFATCPEADRARKPKEKPRQGLIPIAELEPCKECDGAGDFVGCEACKGTGKQGG